MADRIRKASEHWEPAVEAAIFDTVDPVLIEESVVRFVEDRLGRVAEALFYRPGVGVVVGLRLVDGVAVVLKVHRWNVSVERLSAVQGVQTELADKGLPAPRPLLVPEPFARGIATVEELRPGSRADGHDPVIRRAVAAGLRQFVDAGVDPMRVAELGYPLMIRPPGAPLWFEPHDLRFDFAASTSGAEWIDDLAARARSLLHETRSLPMVVGHYDWRVENLGFEGSRIGGIYDWDSLAIAAEPVVVGNTAAIFSADWTGDDPDPLPTLAEMRAFVADYDRERGGPFAPSDRAVLDAANLFACTYGARCQHSDIQLYPQVGLTPEMGWLRLLREREDSAL